MTDFLGKILEIAKTCSNIKKESEYKKFHYTFDVHIDGKSTASSCSLPGHFKCGAGLDATNREKEGYKLYVTPYVEFVVDGIPLWVGSLRNSENLDWPIVAELMTIFRERTENSFDNHRKEVLKLLGI